MEVQGAVQTVELTEDSKGIFDKMFPKEQEKTIEETVAEAVIEEQKPITDDVVVEEKPVSELSTEEPIVTDDVSTDEEDRIGITPLAAEVQKKEVAEPVVEKVVEKSTRVIPFKDELSKIIYNIKQGEEKISLTEIEEIYNKDYENLSDLDLISYSIRTNPDNKGISPRAINTLIQREIDRIQGNLDLDDQDDQEVFNGLIKLDANKVKKELEGRRIKLIENSLFCNW